MPIYVALLHSIVVSPGRRVSREDLEAVAGEVGLHDPQTVLATGNLIFESATTDVPHLETSIEEAIEHRLGKRIAVIIRTGAEWKALVAAAPYPRIAARQPGRLSVRVMRHPYPAGVVRDLDPYRNGCRIRIVNGDLWVHEASDGAAAKIVAATTTKRFNQTGTWRVWNTISRIARLVDERQPRGKNTDGAA